MGPRTLISTAGGMLGVLVLASTLSAATGAAKRPLTIKASGQGTTTLSGTFTLAGANAADSDSGTLRFAAPLGKYGTTAERLIYTTDQWTETLKGKRGTLVIRSTGRRYPVVKEDEAAFLGTWSIVRGTGKYDGLKGGGGVVGVIGTATKIIGTTFSYRYEGIVTSS
jgi:hypothetical protein